MLSLYANTCITSADYRVIPHRYGFTRLCLNETHSCFFEKKN